MKGWTNKHIEEKGLRVVGDKRRPPVQEKFRAVLPHGASEHLHQRTFFEWARHPSTLKKYPQLAVAYAIPNGGHRHPKVAAEMKREGALAGVPDICVPIPAEAQCNVVTQDQWRFAALYIELKTGDNDLTDEQDAIMRTLEEHGNAVATCHGWKEARDTTIDYLTDPEGFVSGI